MGWTKTFHNTEWLYNSILKLMYSRHVGSDSLISQENHCSAVRNCYFKNSFTDRLSNKVAKNVNIKHPATLYMLPHYLSSNKSMFKK